MTGRSALRRRNPIGNLGERGSSAKGDIESVSFLIAAEDTRIRRAAQKISGTSKAAAVAARPNEQFRAGTGHHRALGPGPARLVALGEATPGRPPSAIPD